MFNSRTCAGLPAGRRPGSSSHVWVVFPVRDPGALDGERRKRPCVVSVVAGRVSSSSSAWMPVRTVEGDKLRFMLLVRTPEVERLRVDVLDDPEDFDPVEAVDLKLEHICKHAKLKTITRLVGT